MPFFCGYNPALISGKTRMPKAKRKVEVLVLSDIHLGTFGCHATALLDYLKSVEPEMVILNGDIVDAWQFSKWYWPKSHWDVVKHLVKWLSNDIPVVYLTGNHDDVLRRLPDLHLGSFTLAETLVLDLQGQKTWFFHGDVFDSSIQHARWLAKLGGKSYDALILLNRAINWASQKLGKGPVSLSAKIKHSVKQAVAFMSDFEGFAADYALQQGYNTVVCGHIHQAADKNLHRKNGSVRYLNSGDWIESLTALEYAHGRWRIHTHKPTPKSSKEEKTSLREQKEAVYAHFFYSMGNDLASNPR